MALTQIKTNAIADDAVTEDKILNDAVTAAKIPANAIGASELADNAVDTAAIANNAVTQAKVNLSPNKNLIINGAMQVAQRGTSTTAANGYGTVDRFATISSGLDEATTKSQADISSGTTPYTLGFRKSLKIQNGNQTGGAAAADYISIRYRIEAQDVAQSGWNYTSASSFITLSFWVKSSVAQNFYGRLLTNDGSVYSYPFETGSLSADTWTKVTKTIPGNSNLTVNNDNGIGLQLHITQFWGTNYTDNSVTLNQWGAHNGNQRVPDYTTTWFTTNDATFEITGLQLEVGSVATDFEHRSYGQELDLCKRYFQVFVRGSDGVNTYSFLGVAAAYSSVQGEVPVRWEKEMRTWPSLEISSGTNYFTFTQTGSNAVNLNTFVAYGLNKSNGLLYQAGLSGLVTGRAYRAQTKHNSAYVYLNAEL